MQKELVNRMVKKGYFITFEGPEGSGKSTQAEKLYRKLMSLGHGSVLTREPGGIPEAEAIRGILKDKKYNLSDVAELYLFSACRNMFVSRIVRPNIEKGIHVISDRFADSTRAYQGYAGGIDPGLIERLINDSTGGLSPDLTIILDVDPKVGLMNEVEDSSFSQKPLIYHERVRNGYLDIAAKNPERCFLTQRVEGEIEQTHEKIMLALKERLGL
jgi:dTMP kinase